MQLQLYANVFLATVGGGSMPYVVFIGAPGVCETQRDRVNLSVPCSASDSINVPDESCRG